MKCYKKDVVLWSYANTISCTLIHPIPSHSRKSYEKLNAINCNKQPTRVTNKSNNFTLNGGPSTHIFSRACFWGILLWLAGTWSASPQAAGESFYSLHSLRVFFRIITIHQCIVVMAQMYIYCILYCKKVEEVFNSNLDSSPDKPTKSRPGVRTKWR